MEVFIDFEFTIRNIIILLPRFLKECAKKQE